jgi:hypothetical protein
MDGVDIKQVLPYTARKIPECIYLFTSLIAPRYSDGRHPDTFAAGNRAGSKAVCPAGHQPLPHFPPGIFFSWFRESE